MKLLVRPSLLRGEIAVTGSKSHTIRGIAAALAANGTSVLVAPLESADTRSTLEAARLLGAKVREHDDVWEITGTGGVFTDPGRRPRPSLIRTLSVIFRISVRISLSYNKLLYHEKLEDHLYSPDASAVFMGCRQNAADAE